MKQAPILIRTLIYPERCPDCCRVLPLGDTGFCADCQEKVLVASEPTCLCCGKPISDATVAFCRDCARRGSRAIVQNKAAYVYEGAIKQAMYRFKYGGARWIGRVLAKELFVRHQDWLLEKRFAMLIPVPIHDKRLHERGYNQAQILVEELAKQIAQAQNGYAPRVVPIVRRVVNTLPQKKLDAVIRRKNLKRAFKLDKSVVELERMQSCAISSGSSGAICDSVLVVDDIFTTGATLEAIAALLVAGGVARKVCTMTAAVGRDI